MISNAQQYLLDVVRFLITEAVYDDGDVILGAIHFEVLERAAHAIDQSIKPIRVDSSVDPCPHACEYCRLNDSPYKRMTSEAEVIEVLCECGSPQIECFCGEVCEECKRIINSDWYGGDWWMELGILMCGRCKPEYAGVCGDDDPEEHDEDEG